MAAGYLRYPHIHGDRQPLPALPRVATGPGQGRRPLPPRPGSLVPSDAGAR